MNLVVGLGNNSDKYIRTRHNAGFILLDNYCSSNSIKFSLNKKLNSFIAKNNDTIFCKPDSFMNNSGTSVLKVSKYFDINYDNIVVVHDDIDLEFSKIKFDFDRGSAGHNGIKDIINKLQTKQFYRLRIGVGRPKDSTPVDKFVLQDFKKEELDYINKINLKDYISFI